MALAYREIAPCAALAPFVKCFWALSGRSDELPIAERILPDGAFELVFHCGDPFFANDELQPKAMLVGQIRRPTIVTRSMHADVIGVRFRVGGASAFFREPLSEFRDQILPAREFLDNWEQVIEAKTLFERIAILERMLLRRMNVPHRWNTADAVIALIARRRGNLPMRQLLQVTGCTERTIERVFNECVGIPAKTFSRLVRLHAYLADPLRDHGYFDDAHLIHDFHAFVGTSPGQFRREQHAINDAFATP